jgi:hypothetical protein
MTYFHVAGSVYATTRWAVHHLRADQIELFLGVCYVYSD